MNENNMTEENVTEEKGKKDKKPEHKALTVLKAFLSLVVMLALFATTSAMICGITLRQTFARESVEEIIDNMSFSNLKVGSWLSQEEDYKLSEYLYAFLEEDAIEEDDIADVLDSRAFKEYAADKVMAYIDYIYSRKGDVSVTAEELIELCQEPLEQAAAQRNKKTSSDFAEKLKQALDTIGVEEYSASEINSNSPRFIGALHYGTSWLLIGLLGLVSLLFFAGLILLNKRYLYKLLLYLGIPALAEGISGLGLRLLSYPLESLVCKKTLIPAMIVDPIGEAATEKLLLLSLILLAVGAVFLLLHLIIRKIRGKLQKRREAKLQKEETANPDNASAEPDRSPGETDSSKESEEA